MTPKRILRVPPQHRDRLDTAKVPIPQFSKTKEEWLELTEPIQPADIFLLEKQPNGTLKAKVSDGVSLYHDLPYLVDSVVGDNNFSILENQNGPGGVLVLNQDTLIDEQFLPIIYTGRLKVADTYTEMVAKGNDPETGYKFKQGPVMVLNATDDPDGSVQKGGGYYVWVEDLDEPGWIKVSEFKEPESTLEEYFKFTGTEHHTMGVIPDDENNPDIPGADKYRKFSYKDHSVLYSLVNESENTSVKYTHAIVCSEINMAKLEQILAIPFE